MEEKQNTLFDDTPDNEECELVYGDIDTVVYLLKMDNDTVKIGITDSIKKRIPQIEHASGNFVLEGYHTKKFYNTVAREIESLMHERFEQYRKVGEYFYITLDAAREKLQNHSQLTHFTPKARLNVAKTMLQGNDVDCVIATLGNFINTHEKYFSRDIESPTDNGKIEFISARAPESYGHRFINGDIAFYRTSLIKILEEELSYASGKKLIDGFCTHGFLKHSTGLTTYHSYIHGERKRVVLFKANIFKEEMT